MNHAPPLLSVEARPHIASRFGTAIWSASNDARDVRTFNQLREVATRLRAIAADMDATANEQEAEWRGRTP